MSVQSITAVHAGAQAPRASSPLPEATAPPPPRAPSESSAPQAREPRASAPVDRTPDLQLVQQTTQYLQQLLAARALGGQDPRPARPAHITPERLSALVSYLEAGVSADGVDVAG